jgi:hypothetical protein
MRSGRRMRAQEYEAASASVRKATVQVIHKVPNTLE